MTNLSAVIFPVISDINNKIFNKQHWLEVDDLYDNDIIASPDIEEYKTISHVEDKVACLKKICRNEWALQYNISNIDPDYKPDIFKQLKDDVYELDYQAMNLDTDVYDYRYDCIVVLNNGCYIGHAYLRYNWLTATIEGIRSSVKNIVLQEKRKRISGYEGENESSEESVQLQQITKFIIETSINYARANDYLYVSIRPTDTLVNKVAHSIGFKYVFGDQDHESMYEYRLYK